MELTYTKSGDYYIPDLALDDETDQPLGRFGRLRETYLREHHHGTIPPCCSPAGGTPI